MEFARAFLAAPVRLLHDVVAFITLPAAILSSTSTPPDSSHLPHSPPPSTMPRTKDSKAFDLVVDAPRRQMVHVKTKEECRLANETVDVWSIELPSKHAEAILKYAHPLSFTLATSLTVHSG